MKIKQITVPVYQIELSEDELKELRKEMSDAILYSAKYPYLSDFYGKIAGMLA